MTILNFFGGNAGGVSEANTGGGGLIVMPVFRLVFGCKSLGFKPSCTTQINYCFKKQVALALCRLKWSFPLAVDYQVAGLTCHQLSL